MKNNIESPIHNKSMQFAVRVVHLCKHIRVEKHEYDLASQLLRSGTSIGANIRESKNAQSRNDFISKLNIALKESDETSYWLTLLHEAKIIDNTVYQSMHHDCVELIRMLTSSINTLKKSD